MDVNAISSDQAGAIIDGALLDAQTGDIAGVTPTPSAPGLESVVMPGPLPTDVVVEKTAVKTEEKLSKEQIAAQKTSNKLQKAQEDMLGKEQAEQLKKEEEEKARREATLLGAGEKLLSDMKQKSGDTALKIAKFPTPGNIAFPLSVLLVMFFILITYGGKTRAQWLWLVLTNNAYVSASQQTTNPTTGILPGSNPNDNSKQNASGSHLLGGGLPFGGKVKTFVDQHNPLPLVDHTTATPTLTPMVAIPEFGGHISNGVYGSSY